MLNIRAKTNVRLVSGSLPSAMTFVPKTENGAFFCNECDSKFAEDEALKQHMLQVHSDKPYKCDRCQAAFRYKGNLASHKTVHTGTSRRFSHYLSTVRLYADDI